MYRLLKIYPIVEQRQRYALPCCSPVYCFVVKVGRSHYSRCCGVPVQRRQSSLKNPQFTVVIVGSALQYAIHCLFDPSLLAILSCPQKSIAVVRG